MPEPRNTLLNFYDRIQITDTCWNWTGCLDGDGYGRIRGISFGRLVHRISYHLTVADLIPGMTIDHLCRNRKCVNPLHLEQVTPSENTLRGEGISANNKRKSHCYRGHKLSQDNIYESKGKQRICKICSRIKNRSFYARQRLMKSS